MRAVIHAFAAAAVAATVLSGCQTEPTSPVAEYDGRNLYLGYCASCHGPVGAGDGPVAPVLGLKIEDLRTLALRKGVFPHDWLREVIDGRTLRTAHGSREMPVWGWQFQLEEEGSEELVAARIDALVEYLRTIQFSDPAAADL